MKFERVKQNSFNSGCVIWITGLSGAGKTTLAEKLGNNLKYIGIPYFLLDGDLVRKIFQEDKYEKNYSYEERKKMSNKYSRLSLLLASQGYCVITSVISMFEEVYNWNKKNLPGYYEIFLDIPLEELKKRDSKGIYKKFEEGNLKNIAGLDLTIQKPTEPDMHIIDNNKINTEIITNFVIKMMHNSNKKQQSLF